MNRNYPPLTGATGYHAHRLMKFLESQGTYEVHIVTVGSNVNSFTHSYIKPVYSGKKKIIRLFSTLIESYLLIKTAKHKKASAYIIMTDPPFLNFWAARMLSKERWMLWTMDLYPEAFAANKLLSKSNILYKIYEKVLRTSPPCFLVDLGEHQKKYLEEKYFPDIPSISMPVGLLDSKDVFQEGPKIRPDWADAEKIIFGYIGTLGEAHDDSNLIKLIKLLDSDKHIVIVSCKGSKAKSFKERTNGLSYLVFLDHLSLHQMRYLDIQIVSLLPRWTHVCVPSKALSAIASGNAVLFIGEEQSDTWEYIHSAGWVITEQSDIYVFLKRLNKKEVKRRKEEASKIASDLDKRLVRAFESIDFALKNNRL